MQLLWPDSRNEDLHHHNALSGCELGLPPEMNECNISACQGEGRRKRREGGSASGLQAELLVVRLEKKRHFLFARQGLRVSDPCGARDRHADAEPRAAMLLG